MHLLAAARILKFLLVKVTIGAQYNSPLSMICLILFQDNACVKSLFSDNEENTGSS